MSYIDDPVTDLQADDWTKYLTSSPIFSEGPDEAEDRMDTEVAFEHSWAEKTSRCTDFDSEDPF